MTQNLGLEEIRPPKTSYFPVTGANPEGKQTPVPIHQHFTPQPIPADLCSLFCRFGGDIRFWYRAFKGNSKRNLWIALLVNHSLSDFLDALVVSLESSTACQMQWVPKPQSNMKSKVSFPKVVIDTLCSPLKPRGAWP